MLGMFDRAEALRKSKARLPIMGEQDPPVPEDFHIRVKVIDDACCQLDCIEPVIAIPDELPDAVVIDTCRIVNISSESSIVAPGIVAVRVFFDLVVTYIDALGGFHTVTKRVAFPDEVDPAKAVALPEADRDIHQTVIEVSATCSLCLVEGTGRRIRCVVFLFICIKIGRYMQLIVSAYPVGEQPECEPAETTCPEVVPQYIRRRFGL